MGHGHFTSLDWLVLVAYFLGTIGVGLYFHRRSRSTEGFMTAERSLPGWLVGLSIFATYLSSISYLALPGKAFAGNWNAFVFSFSVPIATLIAVVWFIPYYRRSGQISAYASLESRFGPWARVYASVLFLMTQLARMGVVTYLLALPMSVSFGWDLATIMIVTGVVVTLYTFIGGIVAVIWTDAIQTFVLFAGAVVVLVVLVLTIDGGVTSAVSSAWEQGKFSLGELGVTTGVRGDVAFHFGTATILVVLLYGICDNLKNFGIDQNYVQRYQVARSDADARRSLWLGAVLYLPVSAMFFLIGTLLFVLYSSDSTSMNEVRQMVAHRKLMQQGVMPKGVDILGDAEYKRLVDAKAATLRSDEIGDSVFPHFIVRHLPPGITGLLIAAIFSAGMSTVSSSLNSSATLILKDYYQRFFRPNASERESMGVLYAATIVWGGLGTGVGLLLIRLTDSALDIWWTMVGVFGGGMLGLFLIGLVHRRLRSVGAMFVIVLGTMVILYQALPDIVRWLQKNEMLAAADNVTAFAGYFGGLSPYHPYTIPVFGTATMLVLGGLVALMGRGSRDDSKPSSSTENM